MRSHPVPAILPLVVAASRWFCETEGRSTSYMAQCPHHIPSGPGTGHAHRVQSEQRSPRPYAVHKIRAHSRLRHTRRRGVYSRRPPATSKPRRLAAGTSQDARLSLTSFAPSLVDTLKFYVGCRGTRPETPTPFVAVRWPPLHVAHIT